MIIKILQCYQYAMLCIVYLWFLIIRSSSGSSNFRGGTKSYGMHIEASQAGTNLHYDLPAARVKASPSKDWKVTNNDASMTSLLTPAFMTLTEIHPKFEMGGSWPKYKMKLKIPEDKTFGKSGIKNKNSFEEGRQTRNKTILRMRR